MGQNQKQRKWGAEMNWLQRLNETYEQCAGQPQFATHPLLPIGHTTQQAHVEIVIDAQGSFRRASVIDRDDQTTMIPCTERSGGRAGSKPKNHPLCDKLQYVAGEFRDFGGNVTSGFAGDTEEPFKTYRGDLAAWASSGSGHPSLSAILSYIDKRSVIQDLVNEGVLYLNPTGKLLKEWTGDKKDTPPIFANMPANSTPEEAFIRWRVETPTAAQTGVWEDLDLVKAWIDHYASQQTKRGVCMVTGSKDVVLAVQHPAKVRHAGDKAKLISSNDTSGYTFRGRFLDADETCGVGFVITQQAHNALRWLLDAKRNQAFCNGDQRIVAWAVSGKPVPDMFRNSAELFGLESAPDCEDLAPEIGDAGQAFALRLKTYIAGYRADIGPAESIVVMALDSATPGRMAIPYYRDLTGSEFLDRVQAWHSDCAWYQNYGGKLSFVGAPSPNDITEVAYGKQVEGKSGQNLRKATAERLLPCITDGRAIPKDLVGSTIRSAVRLSNRSSSDRWKWEKAMGIACALFRGHHKRKGEDYLMTLEGDRKTRDYLFGRLLAVADGLEGAALYVAGEQRPTNALKLMQRFADRPSSTWRTIELSLVPSRTRLQSRRPGWLRKFETTMDEVMCELTAGDFMDDHRLSGEFLLAYHTQREALRPKGKSEKEQDSEDQTGEGE